MQYNVKQNKTKTKIKTNKKRNKNRYDIMDNVKKIDYINELNKKI